MMQAEFKSVDSIYNPHMIFNTPLSRSCPLVTWKKIIGLKAKEPEYSELFCLTDATIT